jgi:hypothetical protein
MKRPITFYILLITIVTLSLSCGLSNQQSDVEIQLQVDATINAIHRETASSNADLPVILTFTRVPITEESPNPFQPKPTDPPILPTTPSPDSEAPSINTNDNSVYYPLRDCAPSRVYLGYIVSPENGVDYISIRSEPDTHPSDNKIGKIYPGEQAKIVGGPLCNYGWILWKIKKLSDGMIGWIPESNGEEFWLKSESSESSDLPDSPLLLVQALYPLAYELG